MNMEKDIKQHSFDLLRIFYDGMEKGGVSHKIFRANIDDEFVAALNSTIKGSLSLEDCQKIADICLANEWLEHTVMGGKYNKLRLTTTGVGVVKSKLKQIESLGKRSFLKRISDYVNDHSGVFVLLSIVVSIFSLVVAVIAIIVSFKQGN
jgi:hypothetical protein